MSTESQRQRSTLTLPMVRTSPSKIKKTSMLTLWLVTELRMAWEEEERARMENTTTTWKCVDHLDQPSETRLDTLYKKVGKEAMHSFYMYLNIC